MYMVYVYGTSQQYNRDTLLVIARLVLPVCRFLPSFPPCPFRHLTIGGRKNTKKAFDGGGGGGGGRRGIGDWASTGESVAPIAWQHMAPATNILRYKKTQQQQQRQKGTQLKTRKKFRTSLSRPLSLGGQSNTYVFPAQ